MRSKESLQQFQERWGITDTALSPVHVSRLEDHERGGYGELRRRDFYKIMLFERADGILHYADKSIAIRDRSLVFTNSMIPYCWEGDREQVTGSICVFTEPFVTTSFFKPGGHPVFYLDEHYFELIATVFQQMLHEVRQDYVHKYDLIRNYIQIVIHTSLKMQAPVFAYRKGGTSNERITGLFFDLLERQFPIESHRQTIVLKNANEFAERMNLHTNHLNKALKEYTGKTTTEHIADHIGREARSLLLHSDWTVAEIAHSLGFNHLSNFDTFFKRHTGQTPLHFRNGKLRVDKTVL